MFSADTTEVGSLSVVLNVTDEQCTVHSCIDTLGRHMSPSKVPLSCGDLDTHLIGLTRVSHPNSISIGSAIFAHLTSPACETHRQTDLATQSVAAGHIYARSGDAA